MSSRCPRCGATYDDDDARYCVSDGTRLMETQRLSPQPGRIPTAIDARKDELGGIVGRTLGGRYRIVKKVGEGGMSLVYLANDTMSRARVAVKILSAQLVCDSAAMERLRREAEMGSRLAHPNVCHIIGIGETERGIIYIVMPFVDGEPLYDRTARLGTLSLDVAVRITRDIAAGLEVAHSLGIVHRDLKPENVMLCPDATHGERAVVMDFGLAKQRRVSAQVRKLTKTGIVLGTPEFMSPEQLRGKLLDARSDVYSLGLITYEMLSGKLPFIGRTQQEVMLARLKSDPAPLAQIRGDLDFPPEVDRVLIKCLSRDPGDRYATAAEFAEALAIAATVGGAAPRPSKWKRILRKD